MLLTEFCGPSARGHESCAAAACDRDAAVLRPDKHRNVEFSSVFASRMHEKPTAMSLGYAMR